MSRGARGRFLNWRSVITLLAGVGLALAVSGHSFAFTLHVVDGQTNQEITTAYRWMVEVDNTFPTVPGAAVTDQLSFSIHNSYAPIASLQNGDPAKGDSTQTQINVDPAGRYYVSVLPNGGYAMGGAQVPAGATDVTVFVQPYPIPTAQISVFAFQDHWPINNAADNLANEPGIGGATLQISDAAGPLWQDAFGNPLGTQYHDVCLGDPDFDPDFCVTKMGDGVITTLTETEYCNALGFAAATAGTTNTTATYCDADVTVTADPSLNPYDLMPGEAIVKYLPPGKYGIVMDPPKDKEYVLTSTIEGTPTVDAWVQANEAPFFIEQFGAASPWHAFFGFVTPAELPWAQNPPAGPNSISGQNRFNHFSRPPNNQSLDVGPPVDNCWVGVNDPITGEGLYAAPCDANSRFSITGVPDGSYELVTWDKPLDALFGFHPVTVSGGQDIDRTFLSSRWFASQIGTVFIDEDGDGFRDPGEVGLQDQAVNLRFRDGTIYQAVVSDPAGEYELTEIFPFFKWLVTEVDFLRYKATGVTAAADMGGTIPPMDPTNDWITPSFGMLNPQPQTTDGTFDGPPLNNPNTQNNLSWTETGEVLTLAVQDYLTQTNAIDWGKDFYGPGPDGAFGTNDDENGGLSGIVYYAVTRAENDPRYAAAETWEPGIPNVQVNLYHDDVAPFGRIDCLDDTSGAPVANQNACTPQLADIDNPPLNWNPLVSGGDGTTGRGPEDIDHNGDGTFDFGDAVQITYTDSWNDSKPSGCIQDLPVIHGSPVNECYDGYGTWNQVRPGVFDGGYAFGDHYESSLKVGFGNEQPVPLQTGTYIVEAGTPHGYLQVREEDKNVDFGDEFMPSTQVLPPVCVGDPHTVPQYLSLWTDENGQILPDVSFTPAELEAPFAGQTRPLCDRKQVRVTSGLNAAAEFFFFTKVPKAARGMGFVNNDLAPEFNAASPAFGEKMSPSWLPVSLRDWAGNEVAHTYTDEFGSYEFMVPGSYTVNQASPTGVTLAMYNIIVNDPFMQDPANPTGARIPDPWHNPEYATAPWVFQFETGKTSYIDSPIVPTAAFVGYPPNQLDTNPAAGTPVIADVAQGDGSPGALACNAGDTVVLTSAGDVEVPNPDYDPAVAGSTPTVIRDNGFGATAGTVTVGGVALTVTGWNNDTITATVPAEASTGSLVVTRGDNGNSNSQGVTLVVGGCSAGDLFVSVNGSDGATGTAAAPFRTIQHAVDMAAPGDRIFVGAGTYNEQVLLYKELSLQGAGSATVINSRPSVQSIVQEWRDRLTALGGTPDAAIEVPGIMVLGDTNGTANDFAPGGPHVIIDGFKITGGTTGGGIYVHDHGYETEIRNNLITGNQGQLGGGITVGVSEAAMAGNTDIHIHDNAILKNSGVNGGGGVTLYTGSDGYLVENNNIQGNFSRWFGAGVSHMGLSDNGVIRTNVIAFNENFYFAPGGGDGGGIFIGQEAAGTGSGSVLVNANLIQGNMSGSGYGGGIRVDGLNAAGSTAYDLRIYNNMIVNNVAAMAGGGISLQDAVNVEIVNNTVAHNDSTATALLAFPDTNLNPSDPLPAGIQAGVHSAGLAADPNVATNIPAPVLENNIVYQNRSFHHGGLQDLTGTGGNDLVSDGYWDLGITGLTTPGSSALNPDSCLLTSLVGANSEDYDDGTNVTGDPRFVTGYFNTLSSAATLDEGGNNISVRFLELDLALGNYHVITGSAALESGAPVTATELALDYDADTRPSDAAVDIGADESPAVGVTLSADPSSPQLVGVPVTFTGQASGGSGAFEYRFFVKAPGDATATQMQPYSTANTFDWTTPATPGTYSIGVQVRTAGAAVAIEAQKWISYTVIPPASGVTLTADPVSPRLSGVSVTFTGQAFGGTGNYEYRFFVKAPGDATATQMQPYSTANTFDWTTPATTGIYSIGVQVRTVGSTAAVEAQKWIGYTVVSAATGATISADPASPRLAGVPVTFTGQGSGGSGSYEYRFFVKAPGDATATQVQPYSTNNTFDWTTPATTGIYSIGVQVRTLGSTAAVEAQKWMGYTVVSAATGATISADPASPQLSGVPVTFTGQGSGGSGSYEYRFFVKAPGDATATQVQPYSTDNTFDWTTPATTGIYSIGVQVRTLGSTAAVEAQKWMGYQVVTQ